jgi:tRNA modification GTPase
MGYSDSTTGSFSSRRRHLAALEQAGHNLENAKQQLLDGAGELLAEELRLAQQHLGEITGAFTSDDLLGEIFAGFCIGK